MNTTDRVKKAVALSKIARQWKWLQEAKDKKVTGALIIKP